MKRCKVERRETLDEQRRAVGSNGVSPRPRRQLRGIPATNEKSRLVPACLDLLVGHEGLEPSANGLRVHCSTN